jgi:uncharacterized protein (TIGR04255 family)
MNNFVLQPDEAFPTLSQAPVTEAVLELRSRAETEWDEERMTALLKERLPQFPKVESLHGMMTEMRFEPGAAPAQSAKDLGWLGLVMRPEDGKQVVRFQRDTFAFSQLSPYPGWNTFVDRALDLWRVHESGTQPVEIARIGLRFINRIDLTGPEVKLEDYLVAAPKEPDGLALPLSGFLHRDTLSVPGHDFAVQITRTIQPPAGDASLKSGLIIDVDVFSTKPWAGTTEELRSRLLQMRWLKNKAFFGSLTPQAKSRLR